MNVPVAQPLFSDKMNEYVSSAIQRTEISGTFGEYIGRFEDEFSSYCECEYGIATTSGTTALHLALATLDIGQNDEVLVATFTNMATFFAVLYQGATPIPIDIEEDTRNINPTLLEARITPQTKAIIVVHIYGHPVDMDPVREIAKKYNLFVIEDAAEAHGALYKDKKAGSLSDIACFSFYANKILPTGEGGMIVTNNKAFAERARKLQSFAYGKKSRFMHEAIGFNYRMSNIHAAVGCAQMETLDRTIEMKREMAVYYNEELSGIADLQLPVEKEYAKNVYWMYYVVLTGRHEGNRDEVMNKLFDAGVQVRDGFVPGNAQKVLISKGIVKKGSCPVANRVGDNGFYIPSGPIISKQELNHVAETLKEVLA